MLAFARGMRLSRCRTVNQDVLLGRKLLDHLGGGKRMLCQSLNPPQRPLPEPGPESSAVPHGQRGAPIGKPFSGARHRRSFRIGYPHRGSAGSYGKRERSRCARCDQQALASQRPCDGQIAFGEPKVKSASSLLPAARERFVCYWFGVVCECRPVDYATGSVNPCLRHRAPGK